MSSERIARILDFHGMCHYQDEAGHIYGIMPWTNVITGETGEEHEDLTGYSMAKVLWWLGY